MHRTTSLSPVRIIDLLIQIATGNKEVKGCFKGLLGIMEEGVKAIPAGGSQSARRIHEACEGHWHNLIGGIDQGDLIHSVFIGIIEVLIITNATTETADPTKIRLYIRAPLSLGPTRSAHLKANRGIGRKGGGAACRRSIKLIAPCIGADAIVIYYVKIIVFVACRGLLLCWTAHSLLGDLNFCC
jgi:hypothetical protein